MGLDQGVARPWKRSKVRCLNAGGVLILKQMINPSEIRRIVLEQSYRARVGHIGSALGVAEILAVLYGQVLNLPDGNLPSSKDADRDRFVLSKGHAALALYAALHLKGYLSANQLNTFYGDGSELGVHPEHRVRGIDFSTGSLGQGASLGVGSALAARIGKSSRRSFVLLSDAELNEGSVWEALMFAGHHRLGQFAAIVEDNGQQALGKTKDVLDLKPLAPKFEAFGFEVKEVDGNSCSELESALADLPVDRQKPRLVIARTVFGKGVSYMEGQIKWHYWPMSDAEYQSALSELELATR